MKKKAKRAILDIIRQTESFKEKDLSGNISYSDVNGHCAILHLSSGRP